MKCNKLVDVGRRSFLRGGVLSAAGAAAAVVIRSLTDGERSLAAEAFGDALALDSIRFLPAPWPFDRAFVPGRWFGRDWIVWPARTLPVLSTLEAFSLKADPNPQLSAMHSENQVWTMGDDHGDDSGDDGGGAAFQG